MKKSKIVFLIVVFFFLVATGVKGYCSAQIVISQPVKVTSNIQYERNPSVFKAADGTYWLFYARADTLNSRDDGDVDNESYMIYYKTSTDKGATWSPAMLLDKARPAGFIQRDISAFEDNDGKIWVFASSGDSGTCRPLIYYTTVDNGTTWEDPMGVVITGQGTDGNCSVISGTRMGHSHVIYSNATFWLVYQSSGGSKINFSSSYDGINWATPVTIYGSGMFVPKIANINGILYVVTAKGASGQIWLATSYDSGFNWSKAQIAGSESAWTDWDPTIVELSDGKLLVVWAPGLGIDGQQLKLTYSTDGGFSWSVAIDVTPGFYGIEEWWDYWPTILVDGPTANIFYTSEQNDAGTAMNGGNIWISKVAFVTEMSSFTVKEAKIEFKKKPDDDKINVKGEFDLGFDSNDVDILEDVTVTIGSYTETINMDTKGKGDHWEYKRSKGETGIKEMKIDWKKDEAKFEIKIDKLEDLIWENPVTITIQIGDDLGSESITMEVKKDKWEYKSGH